MEVDDVSFASDTDLAEVEGITTVEVPIQTPGACALFSLSREFELVRPFGVESRERERESRCGDCGVVWRRCARRASRRTTPRESPSG